ncbi:MAG: CPBP family intramembrane metalloprotease [Candidatus Hydrogenedentes bacterium]|nr:CPBP family intramembrane metalloprotease [Candidatus Hydrogenedentota bacterium]
MRYTVTVNAVHTDATVPPPSISGYTPDWGKPYPFWKALGFGIAIYAVALYGAWIATSFLQLGITQLSLRNLDKILMGPPDEALLRQGLWFGLASCVTGILGIFLVREVILQSEAPPRAYFGAGRLKLRQSATYLLLCALWVAIPHLVLRLLTGSTVSVYWIDTFRSARPQYPLWLGLVVLAPLFEEMLFRGLLFTGARQTWLSARGAVVLTAVLFAITHYRYGVIGTLWILLFGLLLGIARHRSDTIKLPILMHTVSNFLILLLMNHATTA